MNDYEISVEDVDLKARKNYELEEKPNYKSGFLPFSRDYMGSHVVSDNDGKALEGVLLSEEEAEEFEELDGDELYDVVKKEKATMGELIEEKGFYGTLEISRDGKDDITLLDVDDGYVNPEGYSIMNSLENEGVDYELSGDCDDVLEEAFFEKKPSSYEEFTSQKVKYNDILTEESINLEPGLANLVEEQDTYSGLE